MHSDEEMDDEFDMASWRRQARFADSRRYMAIKAEEESGAKVDFGEGQAS